MLAIVALAVPFAAVPWFPAMRFDAEIRATAVDLWLAEAASIPPMLRLREISLGQVARVESNVAPSRARPGDEGTSVDVVAGAGGQIVLRDLRFPKGARVRVEWQGEPNRYRLSAPCDTACAARQVSLSLAGPDTVVWDGHPPTALSSRTPRYLVAHTARTPLSLDFVVAEVLDRRGLATYALDSVNFDRVDRFVRSDGTVVPRVVSSVIRAEVTLPRVPGTTLSIGRHQTLRVRGPQMTLRSLELTGDTLIAAVSGDARTIGGGSAGADRSIMPTVLDVAVGNPTVRTVVLLATTAATWALAFFRFFGSDNHAEPSAHVDARSARRHRTGAGEKRGGADPPAYRGAAGTKPRRGDSHPARRL